MAVTVGRSAMKPVVLAVVAALDVTALKSTLGAAATPYGPYAVGVWGDVPQRSRFPYVRVDGALEVPNSTFGRNGKDVSVYCQVFDDYDGDIRILEICSELIALLNPAGSYRALVVTGYRTDHVNFDGVDDAAPEELAGKRIRHKTVKFTVSVEESA